MPISPALALTYPGICCGPSRALIELKLIIEPPPCAAISGALAWAAKNAASRLIAIQSRHACGLISLGLWRMSLAALFTKTLMAVRSWACLIACCRASVSVTSTWKNCGKLSSSCTNSVAAVVFKSAKATRAPWAQKARTMAAPIPVAPPVMNMP